MRGRSSGEAGLCELITATYHEGFHARSGLAKTLAANGEIRAANGSSGRPTCASERTAIMSRRRWTLSSGTPVAQYRFLEVLRHTLTRNEVERSVHTLRTPDWCSVVPLTSDGRIILVRQHRYGIDADTLEVPGGIIDPGELPLHAAARELREETGWSSDDVIELATTHANPPQQTTRLHCFLARDCSPLEDGQRLDETEDCEVVLMTRVELDDALDRGLITHALVWTALFAWRRFEERDQRDRGSR
jgi:ADP-ribose pyrophosphatase